MRKVVSSIVPLRMADIDTDVIIPAKYLTTTTKTGLGEHLFSSIRASDPNFPFNLPQYQKAEILVTGRNFGCGSSREHAVWALRDWGIRVVIAPNFADIFYNNALKNQLLPVELSEELIHRIFHDEGGHGEYRIVIDLEKQTVALPYGNSYSFALNHYRKECLLNDMDDLDYILSRREKIGAFKEKQTRYFSIEAIEG